MQLWIVHYYNYRMVGPDLNSVESDCTQLLRSAFDPDPSKFNDSSWLASPYTFDGNTVYAIVLNEYRGDTHGTSRPDQCPSGERLTCLDTSLVMTISNDGGDSPTSGELFFTTDADTELDGTKYLGFEVNADGQGTTMCSTCQPWTHGKA